MDSLVAYASSDEDVPPVKNTELKRKVSPTTELPPRKKRRLPPLPPSLTPPIPESDPSKHQGRIRTQPHVEGQFAAYVYVPVAIEPGAGGGLQGLVAHAVRRAKDMVPGVNNIIEAEEGAVCEGAEEERELHTAVKTMASMHAPFSASFATFATFNNDERTRTFLSLEIGAGHSQFRDLASTLTPTLRSLYQKEYYAQPRFHASIAWALLEPPKSELRPVKEGSTSDAKAVPATPPPRLECPPEFPTIPDFPPSLLASLTDELGGRLRQRGSFDVTKVGVRIGKEVKTYALHGR